MPVCAGSVSIFDRTAKVAASRDGETSRYQSKARRACLEQYMIQKNTKIDDGTANGYTIERRVKQKPKPTKSKVVAMRQKNERAHLIASFTFCSLILLR